MRRDTEGVGGFFEDLPVLAFVLAGVLSVAGTAAWTGEALSDGEGRETLESAAPLLAASVAMELTPAGAPPSTDSVRGAHLTGPTRGLAEGTCAIVSVWCLHPASELLIVVVTAEGDPSEAFSARELLNVLCEGGVVGIAEVTVLVWEAG